MLRIGIKGFTPHLVKPRSLERGAGFTLIEVMAAANVLALGIVLIYEAFFISLDAYNYYSNYLNVATFADEKIWEVQDSLTHFATLENIESKGVFTNSNRRFNWNLSYTPIDETKDEYKLFKIDLTLFWREGARQASISRSAYALYEKQKEN